MAEDWIRHFRPLDEVDDEYLETIRVESAHVNNRDRPDKRCWKCAHYKCAMERLPLDSGWCRESGRYRPTEGYLWCAEFAPER